ncbi:hypothetical protein [Tropicibacter sp. S64]|uniref:hypothetical protein n=1 Tax=Tropicibacter sp. S64 TaxID=3415122 RepID=UPI003C7DA705
MMALDVILLVLLIALVAMLAFAIYRGRNAASHSARIVDVNTQFAENQKRQIALLERQVTLQERSAVAMERIADSLEKRS